MKITALIVVEDERQWASCTITTSCARVSPEGTVGGGRRVGR